MNPEKKISIFGKVLAAGFSLLSIIFTFSKWLELNQIPYLLKNRVQDKYSLFEIESFLDDVRQYVDNETLEFYSIALPVLAAIIAAAALVTIILTLTDKRAAVGVAAVRLAAVLLLSGLFLHAVYAVNTEVSDYSFGIMDEFIKATMSPWLLIVSSVISLIGGCLKPKTRAVGIGSAARFCTGCGAEIKSGEKFCTSCGTKIEENTLGLERR